MNCEKNDTLDNSFSSLELDDGAAAGRKKKPAMSFRLKLAREKPLVDNPVLVRLLHYRNILVQSNAKPEEIEKLNTLIEIEKASENSEIPMSNKVEVPHYLDVNEKFVDPAIPSDNTGSGSISNGVDMGYQVLRLPRNVLNCETKSSEVEAPSSATGSTHFFNRGSLFNDNSNSDSAQSLLGDDVDSLPKEMENHRFSKSMECNKNVLVALEVEAPEASDNTGSGSISDGVDMRYPVLRLPRHLLNCETKSSEVKAPSSATGSTHFLNRGSLFNDYNNSDSAQSLLGDDVDSLPKEMENRRFSESMECNRTVFVTFEVEAPEEPLSATGSTHFLNRGSLFNDNNNSDSAQSLLGDDGDDWTLPKEMENRRVSKSMECICNRNVFLTFCMACDEIFHGRVYNRCPIHRTIPTPHELFNCPNCDANSTQLYEINED